MIESEVPGVMHQIVDDGLGFVSVYQNDHGSMKCRIGWTTLEDAEANYENARLGFEKRVPELDAQLRAIEPGNSTNSKLNTYFGKRVAVYINTGPPTWWLPRFGFKVNPQKDGLLRLRAGWLRGCVSVHFLRKRS